MSQWFRPVGACTRRKGINEFGDVAYWATLADGSHAFVLKGDGQLFDEVLPPGGGVNAINDVGQLVGF